MKSAAASVKTTTAGEPASTKSAATTAAKSARAIEPAPSETATGWGIQWTLVE